MDKLELSTKALELRELLGEDAGSPIDIFSLAGQIDGLTLIFYPLGTNISGMCIRCKTAKLIAINSAMSYGHQRFSLGHELYHLYFDDDESGYNVCFQGLDNTSENNISENEKCADQFASYFLVPNSSLRSAIKRTASDGPLSLQHVIALEQHFGTSHPAMLWRLFSEGYLSSRELNEYSFGVMPAARSLGYDDRLYKPLPVEMQKRTYGHYLKQVEVLRQNGLVSSGKID